MTAETFVHPSTPAHTEASAEDSAARRKLLETAEALFMARGYNAVALRDLAQALGMRQASLYYHFPGGKEEIYVAVAEHAFARHREGMARALAGYPTIQAQLEAVADWFATQPRMCLMGMIHADLPALHPAGTVSVTAAAARGLFEPLVDAFRAAQARGEVRPVSPQMLAGAFLTLLDGIAISQQIPNTGPRSTAARSLIALFLDGARQPAAPDATAS